MEPAPYGWSSIVPPLLAIGLAIATRQTLLALFLGIWSGWTLIAALNPLRGLALGIDACIQVFDSPDNTRVVIFCAAIGAVIAFARHSGGVAGFIDAIEKRRLGRSKKSAALGAWLIGLLIFVESSITILVTGAIAKPVFDKRCISREKLAYILDSTSAPVCILIPFNAWGAYVIGLLANQGVADPLDVFLKSLPFNFYAILAVALVPIAIGTGLDIGPMRRAEQNRSRARSDSNKSPLNRAGPSQGLTTPSPDVPPRAINLLVPIGVMMAMMPIGLLITGNGRLTDGSGSTAVLWAVLAAVLVGAVMYRFQKLFSTTELVTLFFKGVSELVPMATLMVLAFAIGATCKELETGAFVAEKLSAIIVPELTLATLFIGAAIIAFCTGTSFGTFAIMLPLGAPLILAAEGNLAIALAAILSGGVFGDHCSPISDTTVIASTAAGTDHIDHVRTQLPYAAMAGVVALVLFIFCGVLQF